MKEFKREGYTLKAYDEESYVMEIEDDENNAYTSKHSKNWEDLYMLAKELVKEGKRCVIMEIKYEFV
jgi:hypothetical protein